MLAAPVIGAAASSVASAQPLPCSYTVTDIIQAPSVPPFGASPTGGVAISPNGRYVVGYFIPGAVGYHRGFWYDTQTHQFHVLPHPPGVFISDCNDVNDNGLAVGSYIYTSGPQAQRGFVFNLNLGIYVAELMPLPAGAWCVATGINASNVVCGYRSIGSPNDGSWPRTAFRWSAESGFEDYGLFNGLTTEGWRIADDGVAIVGISNYATGRLWTATGLVDLGPIPGGVTSSANDVGSNAHAVGAGFLTSPGTDALPFEYRDGQMRLLPLLPSTPRGTALAISESGIIVGAHRPLSPLLAFRACAWYGNSVVDINAMLSGNTGLLLSTAGGVSEDGSLLCRARTANGTGAEVSVILRPEARQSGDTNCDGRVNVADLLAVISAWGGSSGPADLNSDGAINVADLLLVILNWSH